MYMQYDQRLNYPRSLIIVFIVHILDSTIHPVPLYKISIAVQAGLCLTWSKPQ